MIWNYKKNKGISLIEVVIGVSLILITLVGLVSAYNLFLESALKNTEILKANFLAEEGLEAMRAIRDENWDSNIAGLSEGVEYDVVENGGVWQTTTNISSIDSKFYRSISVSDVLRNANDDISTSGTLDEDTKLFTVIVSWSVGGATSTRTLSAYLTKLF